MTPFYERTKKKRGKDELSETEQRRRNKEEEIRGRKTKYTFSRSNRTILRFLGWIAWFCDFRVWIARFVIQPKIVRFLVNSDYWCDLNRWALNSSQIVRVTSRLVRFWEHWLCGLPKMGIELDMGTWSGSNKIESMNATGDGLGCMLKDNGTREWELLVNQIKKESSPTKGGLDLNSSLTNNHGGVKSYRFSRINNQNRFCVSPSSRECSSLQLHQFFFFFLYFSPLSAHLISWKYDFMYSSKKSSDFMSG